MGDDRNPAISMLAYVGDLGLNSGVSQSIYAMDKANMTQLKKPDGKVFRVDLQPGQTVQLPGRQGLGHLQGCPSTGPGCRSAVRRTSG